MNDMAKKLSLAAATAALMVGIPGQALRAQPPTGVRAGALTCNVASGWAFVFGSTRDIRCAFSPVSGPVQHYVGRIDKFGPDIGYSGGGIVAWAVLAPTSNPRPGALAGDYGGLTAGATVAVGGAVSVLVGGSARTISLQPVTIEGDDGLNVAAGIEEMTLRPASA